MTKASEMSQEAQIAALAEAKRKRLWLEEKLAKQQAAMDRDPYHGTRWFPRGSKYVCIMG